MVLLRFIHCNVFGSSRSALLQDSWKPSNWERGGVTSSITLQYQVARTFHSVSLFGLRPVFATLQMGTPSSRTLVSEAQVCHFRSSGFLPGHVEASPGTGELLHIVGYKQGSRGATVREYYLGQDPQPASPHTPSLFRHSSRITKPRPATSPGCANRSRARRDRSRDRPGILTSRNRECLAPEFFVGCLPRVVFPYAIPAASWPNCA